MSIKPDQTLDCKGLSCPMPIAKLAKTMKKMKKGQVLEMLGTDPGSKKDVPAWCKKNTHELLEATEKDGIQHFFIRHDK